MNTNKHTWSDDPRLTAYALGEMDAAERTAFEAEIRGNAEAQTAIAQIRSLASQLETALAAEPLPQPAAKIEHPVPVVEEDWRAAREAEARARRKADPYARKGFRFPYFIVSGLAVACFAILFFTLLRPEPQKPSAPGYTLVDGNKVVVNGTTYVALDMALAGVSTNANTPQPPTIAFEPQQSAGQIALATSPARTGTITLQQEPFPLQSIFDAKGNEIMLMEKYTITANYNGMRSDYGFTSNQLYTKASLIKQQPSYGFMAGNMSASFVQPEGAADHISLINNSTVTQKSQPPADTETYTQYADNGFLNALKDPISTFSADVDTASYTNIRRLLNSGKRPPHDAVRIEEMVNYFTYTYAPPAKNSTAPFAATMEVAAAPWNPEHRLVRIGIKGRESDDASRPTANLVFLIDVSGSMDEPNKLPLVKESMRMLVNRLRPDDRIAIVTYSDTIDLALASTTVSDKSKILDALDALRAHDGTNGGKGIQLAYEIAKANFLKDGANRVILCTDGDFNIGITDRGALGNLIEEKAKSGVFLTVLGFGMGNLKDATLQLLANKGNGNHGYIDNRDEARRLLVEQTTSTLVTIAKDMKLQVEFNPEQAASYRLIGYEKRMLAKEDFNNDKVDAGEIGAGLAVTALYEVIPVARETSAKSASGEGDTSVDPLKYQVVVKTKPRVELANELLTLKIRYKAPSADMSDKVEFVLEDKGTAFADASTDFKFASAVAGFGMVLRDSPDKGDANFDRVIAWAEAGITSSNDMDGRRSEFLDLVRRAKQIATN